MIKFKKKKKARVRLLSTANRNRAIFFGFLSVFSILGFRSVLFCIIFAAVAAVNIFLFGKAKQSEEAIREKIRESEKVYDSDLTEREKRFMQKYSDSDEDEKTKTRSWIEERIRKMDEEDEYYDNLENFDDEDDFEQSYEEYYGDDECD